MNAWLTLILAGLMEVGFTTCMKLSDGFTRHAYSAGFLAFAVASFWLLSRAMADIPLGTAYAVWTSIGALGTVVVGMLFFGDPVSGLRLVLLATLVGSVIGLKLVS